MADKINPNNDFVAKPSSSKAEPKPSAPAPTTNKAQVKSSADIYKSSTHSQQNLTLNNTAASPKENGSKLDFEIRHKNPILYEKLKNAQNKLPETTKTKQTPPDPSLRVKLSPKGYAINPRKVKPEVPGRLNPFFDDGITSMERLAMVLGDQTGVNLNKLYGNKIFNDYMTGQESSSIAELLNIDSSIFNQDTRTILDFLTAKAELLSEDKFLFDFLQNIVNVLQQSPNPLEQIIQLYMPFPLPFLVKELDEEFELDEAEMREDIKNDKNNEQSEEEREEEEKEEHDEVSISVTTLNYDKIHFLIKFLKSANAAKVYIKGDSASTEISIPIEMAIDDELYGDIEQLDFHNYLWLKPIPLDADKRSLKIRHKGKLNTSMITVTRKILETIVDNDYSDDDNSEML